MRTPALEPRDALIGSAVSGTTNEELMRKVQDNNAEAFGVLYDRLAPKAFRVSLRMLNGHSERAQDAVQDSFLSMWRSRSQYREESGPVQAWALSIVRNRSIDAIRGDARHDQRRSAIEGHEGELRMPGDVENEAIGHASVKDLRALLAALPEQQREVIALAYYGELSHTEIAEHLEVPLGTVKGRMRLGLTRLRQQII